jgi:hypothetical protein
VPSTQDEFDRWDGADNPDSSDGTKLGDSIRSRE